MNKEAKSRSEQTRGRSDAERISQLAAGATFADKRPEAIAQGKLIDAVDNSPRMLAQRRQLRSMFGDAVQLQGGPEEDELLQGKWATIQRQGPEDEELQMQAARSPLAQLQAEPPAPGNSTGLPDKLKSGIESLSGISMDNVNVYYNSPQPAQLNALAYAQGSDIHVAPGQEQHLPHEAWHLVQQAQGRVRPTMQMKDGVPVNDDKGLEHEADVMGNKALSNAARLPGAPEKRRPLQGRVALPLPQRTGPERRGPQTKALRPASSPSENVGGAFRGSQERSLSVEPGGKQNATIQLLGYTRNEPIRGVTMALEIVDDGKQIYIIDRTQATEPVGKLRGHIDYNFDKAANELVLHTFEASPGGAGLGTLLMFELSQVALRGGVKIISVDSPALSAMAAYKVFGGVARNKGEHQELKSMYQEAIVANPGIHHNFIKYEAEAYAENEVAKESYFNPALSKEEREGRSINAKKAYADEKSGEGDYDRASDLKALSHQLIYIVGDLQSKAWSSLSAKWEIGDSEPAYQEEQSPKEEQGAKSSEKCFITTACMAARGLADDCMELAELRAFRDGFLRSRDEGPSLIAEYYRIAPRIVAAIDADPGSKAIYEDLYARLVCRSVELIQAGRRFEALENYRKIVLELESRI